jgi:hypothetical protein
MVKNQGQAGVFLKARESGIEITPEAIRAAGKAVNEYLSRKDYGFSLGPTGCELVAEAAIAAALPELKRVLAKRRRS